jgi:hypothetical protein
MTVGLKDVPFFIFDINGICITNGTFDAQNEYSVFDNTKTNWSFDGKNVCLIGLDGKAVKTIKIQTYDEPSKRK